jgi:hypothetical protein
MAFRACNLNVCAGEWKAGLRVIEFSSHLPIILSVALFAFCAEVSLMRILMAGNAGSRKAQIASVEILHADGGAFGRNHVSCGMTRLATDCCVFSFQRPTGLGVIETLKRRFPSNEREILSVMF